MRIGHLLLHSLLASGLAAPSWAEAQVPQPSAAVIRCRMSYSIEVQNLRMSETNVGDAVIHCFRGYLPTEHKFRFIAINTRDFDAGFYENVSLEAFGINLSAASLLQVLLQTAPGDYKQRPRQVPGFPIAGLLTAVGLYHDEISIVVQAGNEKGFAISRGFDSWAFLLPNGHLLRNPQRTQIRTECAPPPYELKDLRDCIVYNHVESTP